MAVWINWTDKQKDQWKEWVESRPQVIQDMIKKYDLYFPKLYFSKSLEVRVTLAALNENGTVRVNVLRQFNQEVLPMFIPFDFSMPDIDPADLEECDWDGEVEDGSIYQNLED